MQLDKNPWKIYRNGKLTAEVADYATAKRVLKALSRAFPRDSFVTRYQGKSISHCTDGGRAIDG
ncbi:hypothetical protein HJG54_35340 (plasmid) [Leptolyngbya sp. NK1-12]|uniref:Uncharacterized protein n=1 Tax=Leptolyngbya sp. NK1-12 TaxID=2547451 RepID=A0AA96WMR9_9CYAN|nr:hypothetical protein [Leptolyngbya sp. NK1-12]WNZ24749.1 hypothetical protein HJG54_19150 [Leptolyngbya sp. NK1-12]WNZ28189.1 hypothetical protein HJG54_35340 [Leptolyngbya sp. NK1-12]